jgi:hypothetical protein
VFGWSVIILKFAIFVDAITTGRVVKGGCANAEGCFTDIMLHSSMRYHHRHALPIATDPPVNIRTLKPSIASRGRLWSRNFKFARSTDEYGEYIICDLAQQLVIFDLIVFASKKY